jgi:nitrile hydratase subunit beta
MISSRWLELFTEEPTARDGAMNGIHDMGGMTDLGPLAIERDEPVFHAGWEQRVLGMVRLTVDPHYNWDEFRSAIERLAPVEYLSPSYYERWLSALERYLIEKGVVSEDAIRDQTGGAAPRPGIPVPLSAFAQANSIAGGPRFRAGDSVVARNIHPAGHTRLPRYVRGKHGRVERILDQQTFSDQNALGLGTVPRPVYSVSFTAPELWGPDAKATDTVMVDLWEEYLQPCA